jgi:hypothetical protein
MNDSIDENDPGITDSPGQLRSMLRAPAVPVGLKQRVERSLKNEGLLSPRARKPLWRSPLTAALAAAVAFFAIGLSIGSARSRLNSQPTSIPATSFALLFYDGSASKEADSDVDAHRSWATELAHSGHSVSGEKLAPRALVTYGDKSWVAAASSGDAALKGFFLVSAHSEAEALAIARSSPHFKHGGRIVVRRIEST